MSLTLQPPGRRSRPRHARHPEARPQFRPCVFEAFRPGGTTSAPTDNGFRLRFRVGILEFSLFLWALFLPATKLL